ncbi:hypothetical protein [Pyruvatibacter sp.]|uniref:hypothetical protein n=1 Tax=Pyruvatibacter sp. TaxID=1981328 RepID=UPI0032EFEFD3
MWSLQRILRWAAAGLLGLMLSPVVSEFFIELARERGVYDNPTETLEGGIAMLSGLVNSQYFISTLALVAGLSVGLWLDHFLRRIERKHAPEATAGEQEDKETRRPLSMDDTVLLAKVEELASKLLSHGQFSEEKPRLLELYREIAEAKHGYLFNQPTYLALDEFLAACGLHIENRKEPRAKEEWNEVRANIKKYAFDLRNKLSGRI